MSEWINLDASDGSGNFKAYVAYPDTDALAPVVVAIQEIFGVNANMRDICDDLASKGFIAVSPDLFWRQEPGVDISDKTEQEWQKAFELYNGFDVDKGIDDIETTVKAAQALPTSNGKVGTVGYCLGGFLAYLTATRIDINASVGYYGVGIQNNLDEAEDMKTPLILHIAEEDGFVDKAAQAQIHEALDDNPHISLYDYEGQDHAFARIGGEHYNSEMASLANERTHEFFRRHLTS